MFATEPNNDLGPVMNKQIQIMHAQFMLSYADAMYMYACIYSYQDPYMKYTYDRCMYIPSRATTPEVSMPMDPNFSRTDEMLSLWSGRYSSTTSALLLLPSLLPVLRGMNGPPSFIMRKKKKKGQKQKADLVLIPWNY